MKELKDLAGEDILEFLQFKIESTEIDNKKRIDSNEIKKLIKSLLLDIHEQKYHEIDKFISY